MLIRLLILLEARCNAWLKSRLITNLHPRTGLFARPSRKTRGGWSLTSPHSFLHCHSHCREPPHRGAMSHLPIVQHRGYEPNVPVPYQGLVCMRCGITWEDPRDGKLCDKDDRDRRSAGALRPVLPYHGHTWTHARTHAISRLSQCGGGQHYFHGRTSLGKCSRNSHGERSSARRRSHHGCREFRVASCISCFASESFCDAARLCVSAIASNA